MALISVRMHGFMAAALLALSAPMGVLTALGVPRALEVFLIALLGGFTMLAQAVTLWYLPSFAKREVLFEGMAAHSGIILFPAALVGAAFRLGGLGVVAPALALAVFGLVLLASGLFGKRWRGGIPFWRMASPHRAGDTAAMLTLAMASVWLLGSGLVGLMRPTLLATLWPVGILLVTLGALAHYVPRNRGRALLVAPYLASVLAFVAGAALHIWAQFQGARAPDLATWLLLGLPLSGLAMAAPFPTKRAGARMREAAPFLATAVPFAALAVALRVVGARQPMLVASYFTFLVALGLALVGLALLTLPVVFNQRPARAWLWPSWGAGVAGALLLAAPLVVPLPRWPAAALLGLAILLWLAMVAPLRRPRRECPVEPAEPS